jgi:hypothetical protein
MRSWLLSLTLLSTSLASVTPASARSEKTLAYAKAADVWPAAVRFLRVDEKLKLVEKDADAGYVLFDLADEGKVFRGSLEVIAVVVDRRPSVRFVIAIEDRPSYLEIGMLQRLERKLRAELGSPAPAPTPAPPAPPTAPPPPPKTEPPPTAKKPDPDGPTISATP